MAVEVQLRRQLMVSAGLSEKEARVYDLLLTQGEMTGGILEKESGLKKNTYSLLKSLQRKQLILILTKEGQRWYQPAPPDRLLHLVKEQRKALSQTAGALEQVLPEMSMAYRERIGRPVVQYFSGAVGLRTVFEKVYAAGKLEVLSCVGNETPDKRLFDEIVGHYKPMRVNRGIWSRVISPDSTRARALKATETQDLKEKFLIDPEKYPMPAEFDVWNEDKIALMSFARSDFSAVIIEHPDFATTFRSLLRLTMDLLRERESKR